jgi:hypothetical protein
MRDGVGLPGWLLDVWTTGAGVVVLLAPDDSQIILGLAVCALVSSSLLPQQLIGGASNEVCWFLLWPFHSHSTSGRPRPPTSVSQKSEFVLLFVGASSRTGLNLCPHLLEFGMMASKQHGAHQPEGFYPFCTLLDTDSDHLQRSAIVDY